MSAIRVWHKQKLAGAFEKESECVVFREELAALQEELRKYTRALADIACVEDLLDAFINANTDYNILFYPSHFLSRRKALGTIYLIKLVL